MPDVREYLMRPKRYDNIDGTGEMTFGAMMLGFALLGHLQSVLPAASFWRRGWSGILFIYVVVGPVMALAHFAVSAIKKHITYPRTGYVALRPATRSPKTLVVLFAGGAIAAVATFCVIRFAHWEGGVLLKRSLINALLVGPYGWFIFRLGGEHRWKWFVTLLLAAGLTAIALTVTGDFSAYCVPAFLLSGTVWVASGLATLVLYLRHTRACAAPETE